MPVKFIFKNPKMNTWMILHQTSNTLEKCEESKFSPLGLTSQQHAVLMAIKFSPSPTSLTQIADWVDRHANSITLIADRMVKNGLVKRVRNAQDRRSYCLEMTPKGEKYLQTGTETGATLVQEILSCLTNNELQTLSEFLEKIRTKAIEYCYEKKTVTEIKIAENDSKLKNVHKNTKLKKVQSVKKIKS